MLEIASFALAIMGAAPKGLPHTRGEMRLLCSLAKKRETTNGTITKTDEYPQPMQFTIYVKGDSIEVSSGGSVAFPSVKPGEHTSSSVTDDTLLTETSGQANGGRSSFRVSRLTGEFVYHFEFDSAFKSLNGSRYGFDYIGTCRSDTTSAPKPIF